MSICSESDFDQISRTSIDSYMEDIAERPEPKSQIIANAVNVADPPSNQGSSEERGSTGNAEPCRVHMCDGCLQHYFKFAVEFCAPNDLCCDRDWSL